MNVKDIEEVNKLLKQREDVKGQLSTLTVDDDLTSVEVWFNYKYAHFTQEYCSTELLQQLRENVLRTIEQHLQDIENTLTLTYGIELED